MKPLYLKPIILASSSPYRKMLLERLGITFQAVSPSVDETRDELEPASEMVLRLARSKAEALAERYRNALIIGSDQCAVLDNAVLGKPGDFETAFEQLSNASGRTVVFHTGLCVLSAETGEYQLDDIETRVCFRLLNEEQITAYLKKEQPYDCAGSFRAEALGISLFTRIQTDDPNALIGLPLIRLIDMLQQEGVNILTSC